MRVCRARENDTLIGWLFKASASNRTQPSLTRANIEKCHLEQRTLQHFRFHVAFCCRLFFVFGLLRKRRQEDGHATAAQVMYRECDARCNGGLKKCMSCIAKANSSAIRSATSRTTSRLSVHTSLVQCIMRFHSRRCTRRCSSFTARASPFVPYMLYIHSTRMYVYGTRYGTRLGSARHGNVSGGCIGFFAVHRLSLLPVRKRRETMRSEHSAAIKTWSVILFI